MPTSTCQLQTDLLSLQLKGFFWPPRPSSSFIPSNSEIMDSQLEIDAQFAARRHQTAQKLARHLTQLTNHESKLKELKEKPKDQRQLANEIEGRTKKLEAAKQKAAQTSKLLVEEIKLQKEVEKKLLLDEANKYLEELDSDVRVIDKEME